MLKGASLRFVSEVLVESEPPVDSVVSVSVVPSSGAVVVGTAVSVVSSEVSSVLCTVDALASS